MEVYEPIDLPRLHPALEPAERLHLELHGYVVVESVLDADEVTGLVELAHHMEDTVRSGEDLPPPAYLHAGSRRWFRVDNLPHLDPRFLAHLTHPRLWGMAEEAIGGEARLEQSDLTIHRPQPPGVPRSRNLHRGAHAGMAYVEQGLYHFPFVKTLAMLSDVGPDDGGTVVVPGSHRLHGIDLAHAIALSDENPDLLHQVEAPAGSVLLFFESTIHGSGMIESDRERIFLVGGYTPSMYQPWHEYDPDPDWVASQPEAYRPFLSGSNRWLWSPRVRDLHAPVQTVAAARQDAEERARRARAAAAVAARYDRDLARVEPAEAEPPADPPGAEGPAPT